MAETIGKIIKQLRKERNWTQEELAERLGITSQAISKWESEAGMPDISQIVPLATAFGVSTDVLFCVDQSDENEDAREIITAARKFCKNEANLKNCRLWRNKLLEGLKRYPTNMLLLMECLESGICLAYPKNDMYDKENGEAIYYETIKQAKIVEKYGSNVNDIMRANMITVLLHSAYGNMPLATEQADKFPGRCDMTDNCMKSYIAEFEHDYEKEILFCQIDLFYHIEALLDILSRTGEAYYKIKDFESSEYIFGTALEMIDMICRNEINIPPFHRRNSGDLYCLLAQVYLAKGEEEKALDMLRTMVDHDLNIIRNYILKTPLLNNIQLPYKTDKEKAKNQLLLKLNNSAFKGLSENEQYVRLLESVEAAQGET